MKQFSYRERDLAFGQAMLKLRTALGLTQVSLAEYLSVSRRAIGEWESSNTYPKAHHLKHFIELALKQQVFEVGREAEEIRTLWRLARQKIVLDEAWLAQVLASTLPASPLQAKASIASAPVPSLPPTSVVSEGPRVDWGDAPSVLAFYGREAELSELRKWVVEENCRVVSLLGLGGIGKSTLVVNLMHQVAEHFEIVIWRSLRDAPSCEELITSCLQILASQGLNESLASLERQISLLLKHLQSRRVLLVLDNLETLLEEGPNVGHMREGYEGYSRLLGQLAQTNHQSCLLLTSREKPVELVPLEGSRSPVRVLRLTRLDEAACEQLLLTKDITGTSPELEQLSETFSGNPLALKIVAQTIVDLFEGNVNLFLAQGEAIFGGVKKLLDQQFARLGAKEQTLLMWLAILREPANLNELLSALVTPIPRTQLLEMLEALHRRSLIERGDQRGSFGLQSVVLEYLTTRLVEEVAKEIMGPGNNPDRLIQHSLLQAQAKDYVRQSQQRVIIQPLLTRLKGTADGGANSIESYLRQTLERIRTLPQNQQGYAGGNIFNLLIAWGSNTAGWDFAGMNLWQVYLAGVELRNVNLTGADLRWSVFTQGFNSIVSLAYHPDGQFLAGGSQAGNIKVWQLGEQSENTGYSLQLDCQGHSDMVSSVVYSPDGQFLASASYDHTVRVWDASSGQNLLVLSGHTSTVRSVVFSPDGRLFASGSFDNTVQLWRVATGERVATLEGHTAWVWTVAFSSDGRMLAAGSFDGTIRLWENNPTTSTFQTTALLSGHEGWVSGVVFSPDGQTLYSSGADGTIRVWSVADREQLQLWEGHVGVVQNIVISPDGATLATCGNDRTIRLWSKGSEKPYLTLSGHSASVVALAFSPNGEILASSSNDRSLRLWSVRSGEILATLQGYSNLVWSVAITRNGDYMVGTGTNNRVLLWQLEQHSRTQMSPSLVLKGHTNQVLAVTFNSDGTCFASASQDTTIKLWYLAEIEEKAQALFTLAGHTDTVNTLAFHPASNLLASGSMDGTVKLWSTVNRELMTSLHESGDTVRAVVFNPDGNTLASGGNDGVVRLWDSKTGQLKTSLGSNEIPVTSLAYHPNGLFLASAMYDGTIQIWRTADTTLPPLVMKGHQGMVWSVTFRPDLSTPYNLLSGGSDGTVRLWNAESGAELARFQHGGFVRSVAFTPDGKKVVSAGDGGLVKLWDIASGEVVATYRDFQPYEGVNITGASGLTEAQRSTLLGLGAVES